MTENTARAWDKRYAQGQGMGRQPAAILREHRELLPARGAALDVAMGSGRNALYLAELGLDVTGIDISTVAIDHCRQEAARRGLPVNALVGDVTAYDFGREAYDLIVNLYFLERAIAPKLAEALRPGGVLVFETFTIAQMQLPGGPHDPSWLLHPAELPLMFRTLKKLYYRDEIVEEDGRRKAIASLIAQKRR